MGDVKWLTVGYSLVRETEQSLNLDNICAKKEPLTRAHEVSV